MCMNYLLYYPRQRITNCMGVSNLKTQLRSFFADLVTSGEYTEAQVKSAVEAAQKEAEDDTSKFMNAAFKILGFTWTPRRVETWRKITNASNAMSACTAGDTFLGASETIIKAAELPFSCLSRSSTCESSSASDQACPTVSFYQNTSSSNAPVASFVVVLALTSSWLLF